MSYGVKSAVVNATSDGENTVITGVAGKRITIVSYSLQSWHATAAAAFDLRSITSNTQFVIGQSGLVNAPAPAVFNGSPEAPAFECEMGESFGVNNAAGVDTVGVVTYMLK